MSIVIPDGPFDENDSHEDRLFTFLRVWGIAEFALDICILSIMRRHETRTPMPPFPATLERKLGYLKEAIKHLPTLTDCEHWAGVVSTLFMAEKNLRNDIVHGTPLSQSKRGTVHFMVLNRRKGELPTYGLRTVRGSDWNRLWAVSVKAFGYLTLLQSLIDGVAPDSALDKSKEVTREGPIGLFPDLPVSKALRKHLEQHFPIVA